MLFYVLTDFCYRHNVTFDNVTTEVEILDTSKCAVSQFNSIHHDYCGWVFWYCDQSLGIVADHRQDQPQTKPRFKLKQIESVVYQSSPVIVRFFCLPLTDLDMRYLTATRFVFFLFTFFYYYLRWPDVEFNTHSLPTFTFCEQFVNVGNFFLFNLVLINNGRWQEQ